MDITITMTEPTNPAIDKLIWDISKHKVLTIFRDIYKSIKKFMKVTAQFSKSISILFY